MTPLTVVHVDSRGPATPFELLTFLSVARRNLTLAVFTIKPLDSDALSKSDLGPLLIPVAKVQLKVAFPNPAGDQVYLVVSQ